VWVAVCACAFFFQLLKRASEMVQVAVTLADLGTDLGRQGVQVGAPRAACPPGALGEQKQGEDLHADTPTSHHRHECRLRGGPCGTTGAIRHEV
jgi:hypothetical protein